MFAQCQAMSSIKTKLDLIRAGATLGGMPGTALIVAPFDPASVEPHVPALAADKLAALLQHLANGGQITEALAAVRIPSATYYECMRAAEDGRWPTHGNVLPATLTALRALRDEIRRVQAVFILEAQQTLALAGRSAPGTYDWRAHHEHLKHAEATRTRWREHRELRIEQAGTVNHVLRTVSEMPDDQLLELAPPEWRDLV